MLPNESTKNGEEISTTSVNDTAETSTGDGLEADKLSGSVTRDHRCIGCGHRYSYEMKLRMKRSLLGKSAANKRLKKLLAEDCDIKPCPECGLVQPEMVDKLRLQGASASLILEETIKKAGAFAFLGILVYLACSHHTVPLIHTYLLPWLPLAWALIITFSAFSLAWLANFNPNRGITATKTGKNPVPGNEGPLTLKKMVLYNALLMVFLACGLIVNYHYKIPEEKALQGVVFPETQAAQTLTSNGASEQMPGMAASKQVSSQSGATAEIIRKYYRYTSLRARAVLCATFLIILMIAVTAWTCNNLHLPRSYG